MAVLTKKRNLSKSKSRKNFNKSRKNQSRKRNMRGGFEMPKGVQMPGQPKQGQIIIPDVFKNKPEKYVKPYSNNNITRFHSLKTTDFEKFSKNPQENVAGIASRKKRPKHNILNENNTKYISQVPGIKVVPGVPGASNPLYSEIKQKLSKYSNESQRRRNNKAFRQFIESDEEMPRMNYGQNTYAAPTYLDTSIRQNYFDPVTKF
jgi:hypothetical protein